MIKKGERKGLGMGLHAYRDLDGRLHYFIRSIQLFGSRRQEWLGPVSIEEARTYVMSLWDTTRREHCHLGPPIETSVEYTFGQASVKYLEALRAAGREPSTIIEYTGALRRAEDYIGGKPLSEITLEHLEDMRNRLASGIGVDDKPLTRCGQKKPLGPLSMRSRRNVEHTCSMLFNVACKRGWVEKNPFDALVSEKQAKGSKKKPPFRRLHPREDFRLFETLGASWHRCAAAIGLYLGARVATVASLRLQDIDWMSCALCIPCEFNKGSARDSRDDVWVPIPRHVMPHLREQYDFAAKHGNKWLFPTGVVKGRHSVSGHLHDRRISEAVRTAASKIGYPEHRSAFHALRAICNNRLRASGISASLEVAAVGARITLGHANEEAARPYLDAVVEYLRPVFAAYDDWLDRMAGAAGAVKDVRDFRRG